MVVSKAELKAIVKQCLVEILNEGLGNLQSSVGRSNGRPSLRGAVQEGHQMNGKKKHDFDPGLDAPLAGGRIPTDVLKQAIKQEAGGNVILANILADTAMTTLPTQLASGDKMG